MAGAPRQAKSQRQTAAGQAYNSQALGRVSGLGGCGRAGLRTSERAAEAGRARERMLLQEQARQADALAARAYSGNPADYKLSQ